MTKYQLLRQLIVGVLWLGMGAGCQRDDPTTRSCTDGTCCGQDKGNYHYVEYLRDVQVALVGPPDRSGWGFVLKNPLPTGQPDKNYQTTLVGVCDLSVGTVEKLPVSVTSLSGPIPYNYRIWGKAFILEATHTFTTRPIMRIYVDRIVPVE